jgi:hypothetical protein
VTGIEMYPKVLKIEVNYVVVSIFAGPAIPVENESALIHTLALPN